MAISKKLRDAMLAGAKAGARGNVSPDSMHDMARGAAVGAALGGMSKHIIANESPVSLEDVYRLRGEGKIKDIDAQEEIRRITKRVKNRLYPL